MSHGQRVKAALLLALARRPRLPVLDEPATGLDPIARREVLGGLMAVLADEERTVLSSSHNTFDVEQISHQITFIDRGHILEPSDKEAFLHRWRSLGLVLPPESKLPGLPGVVNVGGSSRPAGIILPHVDFEPIPILGGEYQFSAESKSPILRIKPIRGSDPAIPVPRVRDGALLLAKVNVSETVRGFREDRWNPLHTSRARHPFCKSDKRARSLRPNSSSTPHR